MSNGTQQFIFRQCITRNGKRICMPKGRAFRIPISDAKPKDDQPE